MKFCLTFLNIKMDRISVGPFDSEDETRQAMDQFCPPVPLIKEGPWMIEIGEPDLPWPPPEGHRNFERPSGVVPAVLVPFF